VRRTLLGLISILAMAAAAQPAIAGGNSNFLLGGRALDEGDWEPVDGQGVFGVTVDFGRDGWPVQLEAGMMVSGKEDEEGSFDVTGAVSELSFGVQKVWKADNVRPFIGGGLSAVTAEIEVDGPGGLDGEAEDTSGAVYAHGGVYWRIGSRFNIGVDVRALFGSDLEDSGVEGDADYFQAGLLLGWGWPAE